LVGGWQISATYRQTSGLPFSVSDGTRWATNWQLSSFAVPNGQPIPATSSSHSAAGGPNLWDSPATAFAGFREALPGETGSRNSLRGSGFFNIDTGVSKRFTMPWSEKQNLQFRWETFNVTNTAMMDPISASLSLTSSASFGRLSQVLGSPRQMQMALRYSF
jgi:hypothetical protein